MWQLLRSLSDTLGVGFLAMQLIKLIGMAFAVVGPLKFISSLFAGIFPMIANFFKFSFGWSINGLDVMAASIAVSGTLIVVSSISTKEAMTTKYFWRFLLIPYALIVITIAIIVQIATPFAELMTFGDTCVGETAEKASFYGSTCAEMAPQLRLFGDDIATDGAGNAASDAAAAEASGIWFWMALGYLMGLLPLIAVGIFFFKRLSVNKLLKRVAIAIGSAVGLVVASAAFASVFGS